MGNGTKKAEQLVEATRAKALMVLEAGSHPWKGIAKRVDNAAMAKCVKLQDKADAMERRLNKEQGKATMKDLAKVEKKLKQKKHKK